MIFKKLIYLILFIILIQSSYSGYYADLEIDVKNTGEVSIDGVTNLNYLNNIQNSQSYTSKDGRIWTLNITTKESFDNFIYELEMPKYSDINYIKTTPTFRINDEDSRIKIIGTGEGKPLTIIVQYKIGVTKGFISEHSLLLFFIFIFLSLMASLRFLGFRLKRVGNNKKIISEKYAGNEESFDYEILPQRQKDIIDILKDKKNITQKELESMMEIPKSSVSRNVKTLEVKGIIKKEQVGKINYLSLKK